MAPFVRKHWFKLLITVLFIVIAGTFIVRTQGGVEKMPVIKPAPEFRLSDADGRETSLSDASGKVRLVYFFYGSCPDVCYPTNHILSKVQEELVKEKLLGSDAVMLSISFDPDRDTPEKLKEYAKSLRADSGGWKFLRGDEKAVIDLAKQYGVGVIKGNDGLYAHNNLITLVDRQGQIRKYISAAQVDVKYQDIAKSIVQLAKETSK